MTRQTSRPYTREQHPSERYSGGREPREHGARRGPSHHDERRDDEYDPWSRSSRDSGPRRDEGRGRYDDGERSERAWQGADRPYGSTQEQDEGWDDRGDRWGNPWRADRGAGRSGRRDDERDARYGESFRREDRDDGYGSWGRGEDDGWDRSGAVPRQRRDEENDPRPYYSGTYRRTTQPYSYEGGRGMFTAESLTLHGPYTGKGPKGYKRSSERLKEEISDRLERQGDVDASEIEVECKDGIVTLKGKVRDRQTKRRAEAVVEEMYGVEDVMNELRVDRSAFEGKASSAAEGSGAQAGQRERQGSGQTRKG